MSSKVKLHINILLLLTLVIAGFIWKENPYHVFSPAWTVHALTPLFIWFLIMAAFLAYLVIKLRSAEAFISASLDKAREIVTIFDVGEKRFVYVNQAIKDVLGYTAEEVLKDDILPSILFNDQEQPFDNINNIGSLSGTRQLRKKDGSPIYLEHTAIPIHNKGHLDKIVISSWDISKRIKMEQALTTSEKLYRDIVENSYNVIFIYNENGILQYMNGAIKEHTGWDPEQFVGTNCLEWVYPDDKRDMHLVIQQVRHGPFSFRFRMLAKNGVIHVSAHNSPIFDEYGTFRGAVAIAVNIERDLELENKLKTSEEKYHTLYNNAQVGLLTSKLDGSEIIMTNEIVAHIMGYNRASDLIGLPSQDVWANPEERNAFTKLLQDEHIISNYYFEARCRDNSIKTIELFARLNPYTEEIESNLVDVTEKIIADKWAHYQAYILENIQESIIALDTKGKVLFLNRQAQELINSKAAPQCCSNNIQNILAMREADFKQMLDDVLAGRSWQGETILYIDGIGRHFMHRIDSLQENGSVSGAVVISTDITELVKNREQAQAANMAKSQFLANMSHEIRTPMIGILGAVDLLHESKLDNVQNENVEIIRECGEQLLNIINDILDMSKIELSLMELHPRVCNPVNIFNRLVNNIEPLLKNKGLQVKLDISADIPALIRVDEAKLRQILSNLFYNAIKFTNRGYISFTAALEEEDDLFYLSTIISDTGIGIPEYEFKNIFNPFTQVDNSTSRQYGGTGLGLYISKRYVDLMKGTINLTSEEGVGTTFSIKIPVEIISQPEAANESGLYSDDRFEDKLVLGFTPVKILLVEDNDLNQKIVSQMLINYGFEVTLANNGLDCLRLLQERHFDVLLMDMQMPVMDGYEATRMIRQYEELRDIPIIAMTAHAMTGDREKCLASGCTSYIAKPFKSEELAREIRQHFNTGIPPGHNHDPELNNFINELLPEFMAQLEDMVDNLGLAFENRDLQAIKSISHDIKGTAGMYGFKEISSSAALIEKAAREASFPNIKHALEQLYQLYEEANQQVG